ncbi:MAG: 50S ribosomal protein L18e [Desulfurococcaceae archaeon]
MNSHEIKKTNMILRRLIRELRKYARTYNAKIWLAVAEELEKPRRKMRVVNISRINRHTLPHDYVVVPGKVLGAGELDHPVVVAAFKFSKSAIEKIKKAGGIPIDLFQALRERPHGSNVKIVG